MYEFADKRPFDIPVVVIDTETTGLWPEMGHRVVEIGAVRWEDGQEVAQFSTLLNPGRKMDPAASRVNGIYDQDLTDKPLFSEQAAALHAFVEDALLVAHNARFDAGFLGMELFINNFQGGSRPVTWDNPWLCTLELARAHFRFGRNNLGAIAGRLGVTMTQAHRALSDVQTTAAVLQKMLQELDRRQVRTIDDLLYAQGGPVYTPEPPRFVLPEPLSEALQHDRNLTIRYQNKHNLTVRTITPLYPTRFRGVTYLVAFCHSRQDQRTFRLDRILQASLNP